MDLIAHVGSQNRLRQSFNALRQPNRESSFLLQPTHDFQAQLARHCRSTVQNRILKGFSSYHAIQNDFRHYSNQRCTQTVKKNLTCPFKTSSENPAFIVNSPTDGRHGVLLDSNCVIITHIGHFEIFSATCSSKRRTGSECRLAFTPAYRSLKHV